MSPLRLTLTALALALGLAACGQKGPLDPPPVASGEAAVVKPDPTRKLGDPPRKRFALDPLL